MVNIKNIKWIIIDHLMGSWSDNYNSWKNYKGRELIIVKYEDLINNALKSFSK